MKREDIEPRMFAAKLGYNHAVLIEQPQKWLMVSGHESRDDKGRVIHAGNIRSQITLTFQRMSETLAKAGFSLADVVQIRIFTVDLDAVTRNYDAITALLDEADCRPTSLLAEVSGLSDPDMMIEIEAVAAQ